MSLYERSTLRSSCNPSKSPVLNTDNSLFEKSLKKTPLNILTDKNIVVPTSCVNMRIYCNTYRISRLTSGVRRPVGRVSSELSARLIDRICDWSIKVVASIVVMSLP